MRVLTSAAIQREDKAETRSRLHPADGFNVETESNIAKQTVMAGTRDRQFEI